jgi:rRNA-processing protein FCF1
LAAGEQQDPFGFDLAVTSSKLKTANQQCGFQIHRCVSFGLKTLSQHFKIRLYSRIQISSLSKGHTRGYGYVLAG